MINIQLQSASKKHLLLLALLQAPATVTAQTACIKGGGYEFTFDGACNKDNFLAGFKDTVFDDALLKPAGCTNTLEQELAAQLGVSTADLDDGIKKTCKAAQDAKQVITLHNVPPKRAGERFVSDYYNGGTYWNLETETLQFPSDGTTPEQILKTDAANVDSYYDHARREPFVWPNELPQFNLEECELKAAQCCWPQDRQANDNNGNCAKPYDTNCVDKDPGDNTDLCMVDLSYAPENNFVKSSGYSFFPGDNNNGEGPIHCHGFAWGNDDMDVLARYKANNLFYVSMYDHMYQRGYVRNIAGAPMCGCLEKMPIVSRSDCTQTNVSEQYKFTKKADSAGFNGEIEYATLEFQACQGANNNNNDLAAYYQRLVNEGRVTTSQQEVFKKYIVGNNECQNTINAFLTSKGYTTGFQADESMWTYVVGEGDLKQSDKQIMDGLKVTTMFNESPNKIMRRACLHCYNSHKDIYYKRLTPLPENFDILNLMMNDWVSTDNTLNVDFELYSSYHDAVSGDTSKRWTFCNYDDLGVGFPRDCGPTGRVNWNWNSYYRGGGRAEHHAFFVEANPDFDYDATAPVNIALGKTISQSSTGWGGDASRAMDGNTVGIYNWNTVTHTNWNENPYWNVWLGTDATIDKVYFWNRIDCCRNRLSNVKVEVLDGIGGGNVVATRSIAGALPVMNMVDFGGVTGQTVQITITTGGHQLLSLAEVKVFGEIDESQVMKNVAIGGTASASSSAYGGAPSRAIDGNTNGHWGGASVTHTHYQSTPWWKVIMPSAYNVQTVKIWNRYDCCWDRLTNPIVELKNGGTVVKQIKIEGVVPREGGATLDFGGAYGDEVEVRIETTGSSRQFLSLAEVQVFAKTSAPGATESPSASPSAQPIVAASSEPSASPTATASESPSSSPTGSPVAEASSSPTSTVSESPSSSPTGSPVADASSSPTSTVSESPSSSPTGSPVAEASSSPSSVASESPSSSPTGSPVADASSSPSSVASESPSSSPTGSPVAEASSSPSSAASESPSSSPSDGPTSSPSGSPVIQVITQPAPTTNAPTPSPSSSPSEDVGGVVTGPLQTELTTTYEGGNGQAGIMFDIEAVNSLVIEEIDIHIGDTATHNGFIYMKSGTWRGHGKTPSSWTQLGTFTVQGQGEGNPTTLPAGTFDPINVNAGETKGLYITLTSTSLKYTFANAERTTSDDNLKIFKGVGKKFSFLKTFTNRVFNGSIRYKLA